MMRFQAKLERKQMVLFRIVDIGTDLFAMSATISYATMLAKKGETKNALELADLFCREARMRIDQLPAPLHRPRRRRVPARQNLMKGEYEWFEGPLVSRSCRPPSRSKRRWPSWPSYVRNRRSPRSATTRPSNRTSAG